MDIAQKIEKAKKENMGQNEPIVYVVFKGNTLGYLFNIGIGVSIAILASIITSENGQGLNWRNGSFSLSPDDYKDIEIATKKDFNKFRVSDYGVVF